MSDLLFVPPSVASDFVELSRTPQGRLFRKHILTKGNLIHPVTKKPIPIDDAFVAKMAQNFDDGVCPIVQIPVADADNKHTEDPERNIGEVVGIQTEGNKVYALLDIRKRSEDINKTLLGASAMFSMDYTDTATGKKVGPTLLHTLVTNRPYLTGLDDYEEVVAASASSDRENLVFLTDAPIEETFEMDLDAITELLLLEHGINLADLQARAAAGESAMALSNTLRDALGTIRLANGETVSGEDIVGSVVELAEHNVALAGRLETLEKERAAAEVDGLISEGKIFPAQREIMLEIKLSNPAQFDKLIPEQPFVKLSEEKGTSETPDNLVELSADIERYAEMAVKAGYTRA